MSQGGLRPSKPLIESFGAYGPLIPVLTDQYQRGDDVAKILVVGY